MSFHAPPTVRCVVRLVEVHLFLQRSISCLQSFSNIQMLKLKIVDVVMFVKMSSATCVVGAGIFGGGGIPSDDDDEDEDEAAPVDE